jgi:hypothetical protein
VTSCRSLPLLLALTLGAVQACAACDSDASFATAGAAAFTSPAGGSSAIGTDLRSLGAAGELVAGTADDGSSVPRATLWALDASGNCLAARVWPSLGVGNVDDEWAGLALAPGGAQAYAVGYGVDASGNTALALARFNVPALTLDNSFGSFGWLTMATGVKASGVGVDSAGRILVCEAGRVRRFLGSGLPDLSYGSSGAFLFDAGALPQDLTLDASDNVWLSGAVANGVAFWKLKPNASLDSSFGGAGKVSASTGTLVNALSAVVLDGAGVAAAGSSFDPLGGNSQALLWRVTASGAGAAGFATAGLLRTPLQSGNFPQAGEGLQALADGTWTMVGQTPSGVFFYPAVWRVLSNGSLDGSFASSGLHTIGSTLGSMARLRPGLSQDSFATGNLGNSMALWRLSGCDGAAGAATTPVLPAGASAQHPVAYPQPARGALTIAFSLPEAGEATLEDYDERGLRLGSWTQSFDAGAALMRLDVSGYAPGVYLYRILLDLPSGPQSLGPAKFAVKP